MGDVKFEYDSESNLNFTWLTPSMIVEATTPQVGGADWSFKSTIAESDTPPYCDTPSPLPCGSLQFFDSFSLSHLFRNSSSNFDLDGHQGGDPIFAFPLERIATFDDSGICLGQGMTPPTPDDDEALVRMSIKSLDIGEEPVFELPSGWKEASVSPPGLTAPSLFQSEPTSTRKTSVLPKLKSLWKRATSKFVSRQA